MSSNFGSVFNVVHLVINNIPNVNRFSLEFYNRAPEITKVTSLMNEIITGFYPGFVIHLIR